MKQNIDKVHKDFDPSLLSPYYFVRKGLLQEIKKVVPELKGRLMDFGCGSKPYRSLFFVDEYIGVDYENPGHSHSNEYIDVFYDGKIIPFSDEHFDSILCSEVVEHVFNLEHILTELNRVLKPKGKMILTCPFVWNEHEVPNDFARYTQYALKDLLDKKGFEVIAYAKSGNFIKTIFQLSILYFAELSKRRFFKIPPIRWAYKIICYGFMNLGGIILSAILPKNDSLYLNNVLLVEKR